MCHKWKGIDKPRIKIVTRIRVLDKIKGDSMKNPREIASQLENILISISKILLSFIKFEIHIIGNRIPKISNHNVLRVVVIMSS